MSADGLELVLGSLLLLVAALLVLRSVLHEEIGDDENEQPQNGPENGVH